ncbi:MAG: hypothetical protein OXJ36_03460 [bacterium]|nr:hypothetical protein [bacterium]MDE0437442.1 hypothetical protein [bacterium]
MVRPGTPTYYGDVANLDFDSDGVACEQLIPNGIDPAAVAATIGTRRVAATATTTTARPTKTTRRLTNKDSNQLHTQKKLTEYLQGPGRANEREQ